MSAVLELCHVYSTGACDVCSTRVMLYDVAGKLQYVGRSGLPGIPRYTAHDRCLNAEEFTQSIIDNYSLIDEMTKAQQGGHSLALVPLAL